MIIKHVLGECLTRMGSDNFAIANTHTSEQLETLDNLMRALNVVYKQIVTQYLVPECTQEVVFDNGVLMSSSLEKSILYPISVKRNGEKVKFKAHSNRIECNFDGKATLTYAYAPQIDLTIDDSIDDMRLTQYALVCGVLAEYYFSQKVFDLAKNFDTEFRAQMDMLKYKGRSIRLKLRGW